MNSRPKQPKYARNKNILVIGGSGSGKTRFFVKPNLMPVSYTHLDVYKRQPLEDAAQPPERKRKEATDAYSVYEEIIKDNIEYRCV